MNAKSISIELEARYRKARSAWSRGVLLYADELLDNIRDDGKVTEARLLNGARDWKAYSEGGCSLITDEEICKRLSTPCEIQRTNGGILPPNSRESWMEVQARALYQAARLVLELADAR
jgi:hypothetical protein